MSPVASAELVVSKLTLALFEGPLILNLSFVSLFLIVLLDMGWYTANYSIASPNYYGSQEGLVLALIQ